MSAHDWYELLGTLAGIILFGGCAAWIVQARILRSLTPEQRQNRKIRREELRKFRLGPLLFVILFCAAGNRIGESVVHIWVK